MSRVLRVWLDDAKAGLLAREGRRQFVFRYDNEGSEPVSLTMPVRLQSWDSQELHPVFQMNLPEGALLEAIRRAIAKIIGDDEFAILQATGGNQIGRNRFSLPDASSWGSPPEGESLEQLLTYPDTRELFHELVNRYAIRSGVSGVQPKVLLAATERGAWPAAGYIVKTWGADYPHLAANEFFCMSAAKEAGLPVPDFRISENGGLFVMRRFDRTTNGSSLGFEDMCSLQAVGTTQKYSGSYERIARTLKDSVSGDSLPAARRQLFATLVLSSMVRNGDAHLKNFALLYATAKGPVAMAPVFDIVTTAVYLRHDVPALTLAGSKKWWPRKVLERFALSHLNLPAGDIHDVIESVAAAVMATRRRIPGYIADHPEFEQIGESMMALWEEGVRELVPAKAISLGAGNDRDRFAR